VRDVESLVCRAVLVYPDCEMEPGFRVCIGRPSERHPCEGRRDLVVKASAELDYDGFRVGVSGVVNKVAELVEVVVNRPFALEVGGSCTFRVGTGPSLVRTSCSIWCVASCWPFISSMVASMAMTRSILTSWSSIISEGDIGGDW